MAPPPATRPGAAAGGRDVPDGVSVIIPTYNCAPFLGEAIAGALGQTVAPAEVIVIDDGSTDETGAVVARYRGRIVHERRANGGVAAARNRGIELARGDWLLFLDADDRLHPTALEALLGAAGGGGRVVYGDRHDVDEGGRFVAARPSRDCTGPPPAAARANFGGAAFPPGVAIVPRRLAVAVGGFDQRYAPCEDRHFWIRCGACAEFAHAPAVVLDYRDRPGSHSKDRVRQVTRSVLTRIDALDWCRRRGVRLFDEDPDPATILAGTLGDVYWSREWDVVDALLGLAEGLGLDGPEVAKIRRRRAIPGWVVRCKDRVDRLLRR